LTRFRDRTEVQKFIGDEAPVLRDVAPSGTAVVRKAEEKLLTYSYDFVRVAFDTRLIIGRANNKLFVSALTQTQGPRKRFCDIR